MSRFFTVPRLLGITGGLAIAAWIFYDKIWKSRPTGQGPGEKPPDPQREANDSAARLHQLLEGESKQDGIIEGEEVRYLNYVQSYLTEQEDIQPDLSQPLQRIRQGLETKTDVHLSPNETKSLFQSLSRLVGSQPELEKNHPGFYQHLLRFGGELAQGIEEGQGLAIQPRLSLEPTPPLRHYDTGPDLQSLMQRIGIQTKDLAAAIHGHVVQFFDTGGSEIVVLYGDQHSYENHQDFGQAVFETWHPAGFNLLAVENLARDDGPLQIPPTRWLPFLAGLSHFFSFCGQAEYTPYEKRYLLEQMVLRQVPASYVPIECVLGDRMETIGIEDRTLHDTAVGRNGGPLSFRARPVYPAGAYRFFSFFLENSDARSRSFVENLTQIMRGKALFLVGTAHIPVITEELKKKGVSYIVVSPHSLDVPFSCKAAELDGHSNKSLGCQ